MSYSRRKPDQNSGSGGYAHPEKDKWDEEHGMSGATKPNSGFTDRGKDPENMEKPHGGDEPILSQARHAGKPDQSNPSSGGIDHPEKDRYDQAHGRSGTANANPGGHVRPQKHQSGPGQTAGLDAPQGGPQPIPEAYLRSEERKLQKERAREPKPGHTPNDYGKGGPSKYPDGSTTTKVD
jgi:hypothetical protein